MIIIAIVGLIFLATGSSLDLSDPEVLVEFKANVGSIVEDPVKADEVVDAAEEISDAGRQMRSDIDVHIAEARELAISYATSQEELNAVFDAMEADLFEANRKVFESRDRIRNNVTKKEWKKLIKGAK